MNGKTKKLGYILWKVLRNPLVQDLTFEDAAEFTLDYIRILGSPLAYLDKTEIIEIEDYKGALPCDLIHLKGVRFSDCNFNSHEGIPMRYASNTFHLNHDENYPYDKLIEYTYIVQNNIILTSAQRGYVELSYKAIALDEEGYPLIPDDEKVSRGLEYYILYKYLEPLYMMGKISDKAFEYVTQQYDWYVGAADASLRNMNPDQLATVMNGINRIITNKTAYESSFKRYGDMEHFKKYR